MNKPSKSMVEEEASLDVQSYERVSSQYPYFVASVAILTLCTAGVFGYLSNRNRQAPKLEDIPARTIEEKRYSADEIDAIILKAYQREAGEDGVIQYPERRNLLDKLGFDKNKVSLDDNEGISLEPAGDGLYVYINLKNGDNFGSRYMGRDSKNKAVRGTIGMVPVGIVKAYAEGK